MDFPRGLGAVRRRPPLKADPFAQQQLLKLQAVDSTLHTLAHQRANLPEQVELLALAAERKPLEDRLRDARIVVDDLQAEVDKAEADVEQVRTRRARDTERMESGAISSPKDLSRMQVELASLERRIERLEEEELEVMERLETAQSEVEAATAALADINSRGRALMAVRDERAAGIDARIAEVEPTRLAEAVGVPSDLLALYDRLREQKGGVGAAELRARQCGGCMLTLDTAELATIKSRPVDEVIRCEECSRILVRTPESGL